MDGSPCLDLQEINSTNSSKLSGNITFCNEEGNNTLILPENNTPPIIITINTIIGGVGTLGNLSVILVFGKEKKFRRKIPNIFIINQVSSNFFLKKCSTNFCVQKIMLNVQKLSIIGGPPLTTVHMTNLNSVKSIYVILTNLT